MKQLQRQWPHSALWVLTLLLLAGVLAGFVGIASASSPTYTLTGFVDKPGSLGPVPAGVTVDLVSRATGAVYATTTFGIGGEFQFTSTKFSAFGPGYWGVYVPYQTNVTSVSNCKPCAVLPASTSPQFGYYNATALTTSAPGPTIANVSVLPYSARLTGTVTESGQPVAGATVALLDPLGNGLNLVNNTTATNGSFVMKVPFGSWVAKATFVGASTAYNLTSVTVSTPAPAPLSLALQSFIVQGRILSNGNRVTASGNVTLFDTANGDIFSAPTGGGFYSIGTYAGSFQVLVATNGYTTYSFPLSIAGAGTVTQNVPVSPAPTSALGLYNTTVNLTGLNVAGGTGSVSVSTGARLGNDSVFPQLPNTTVGQLWAQLGLDYASSVNYPSTDNGAVSSWVGSLGPIFPAVQAGLTVNGTGFLNPTTAPALANFSSACSSGTCGPSTAGGISYDWSSVYKLNGTIPHNASVYTVAFGFRHPTVASEVQNYTFVLPKGYVLATGTAAPAATKLVPRGPDSTWTSFTLASMPSATEAGSASFNIVKAGNLTANVNVSVKDFTFSSRNILNSTHNNYTVVVGVGENVTFSALNSTYPAGTNGTKFVWNFGDGSGPKTVYQATTNHTFATASGAKPYNGTLSITSSGGLVNSTNFSVWVAQKGGVTAKMTGNWTTSTASYARVNWSQAIQMNATGSTALISPSATVKNPISVAAFTFTAKGYKKVYNLTAASGGNPLGNFTPLFNGAGTYYNSSTINGSTVAFRGWQYNVSLTVWSSTGQSATGAYVIVVNDTEKPTPSFNLLNSAGKAIGGSGIVEGTNGTAKVQLNAGNATDPHNGSITKFYWHLTNSGNTSYHLGINTTAVKPSGSLPTVWLAPQNKSYTVNLTVWDLNGNVAWTTQSLQVSPNATLRPIMAANNLTAPSTVTSGSTYTLWVNVTTGGGSKAVGENVTVSFYLLSPSGTGSKSFLGGSPQSVKFYNYTSAGVVNSVPFATGLIPKLDHNTTVRAEVTWTPGTTGNFNLYANISASNEYSGDLGTNVASQAITVNPNPLTQDLIYGGAIGGGIVVILAIVLLLRRRSRRGTTGRSSTGRSGLERSRRDEDEEKDEDTEDDET